MRRVVADIENNLHTSFKVKLAKEQLTMGEVIGWAIQDYVAGRWKPVEGYLAEKKKGGKAKK